jgi:spore maturation protein CgeB
MLKIKDDVDLKELEKFGFVTSLTYNPLSYVKKVYLNNENDDKNFYRISKSSRKIELTRLDGELDDTLYDLIEAGLVEKC